MAKKLISIISAAYNEEANILACCEAVRTQMAPLLDRYDYEHIIGDNCSQDRTLELLRELAAQDPRIRVISYSRNFGAEKSSMTLMRHTRGDAVIPLPSDLQEPPDMIPVFIQKWEEGIELVCGIYITSEPSWLMRQARTAYYKLIEAISEESLPPNYLGYGLMDRKVVQEICSLDDQNPYMRGLIASVGFRRCEVSYQRRQRVRGSSKHYFRFLLGFGLNAIVSHSLVPLRIAVLAGSLMSVLAVLLSITYAIVKILNWNFQAPGATTTIVLLLFFSGIQLVFLGILGEYIGAIHSQVRRKPFVIIRERINFDQ